MLILKWFINILMGLVVHEVGNGLIEKLGEGVNPTGAAWRRLSRYTVGYVAVFFPFLWLLPQERRDDVTISAYFTAAVSFGGGVAVGYLLDGIYEKEKASLYDEAFNKLFKVDGITVDD